MNDLVIKLAQEIKEAGGRLLMVGGCVRDSFMNLPSKDIDLECYYLQPEVLESILAKYGNIKECGKSFSIYKLDNNIDVGLPRTERKISSGHQGFEIKVNPFAGFEESSKRRDFTINAILKDPLTREIVDCFGGVQDIKDKILRVVSETTFKEDSLRVLRLAKFASRFEFNIDLQTQQLAMETDLSDLPKERVWAELEKILFKSRKPSIGINEICFLLIREKLFPELVVSVRVLQSLDKAVTKNIYDGFEYYLNGLSYPEQIVIMFSCLMCGSENKTLLDQLNIYTIDGFNVRKEVEFINKFLFNAAEFNTEAEDYWFYKLALRGRLDLLSVVLECIDTLNLRIKENIFFTEKILALGISKKSLKPVLQGKHLLELGMIEGEKIGEILKEIYELQMQGKMNSLEYAKSYVEGKYLTNLSGKL